MLLTARRVWVGLWLLATVLACLALWLAVRGDLSVVRLWWDILHWRVGNESWALLQRTLALLPADGSDLYQVVYFEHGIKISYPPSSLLPMHAAAASCSHCSAADLATAFTAIGLLFTMVIPAVMAAELLATAWARRASPGDRTMIVLGVVALCAVYYPLVLANVLGQAQAWLNGLFALAFWGFVRRRHVLSGVAIGVMALVKPYAALLVLWAALRGHRRLSVAALATIVVGVTMSLAVYGLDSHLGYFQMAAVVAERGESLYANQSINGLLNRLFLPQDQIGWVQTAPPPFHPVVAIGTRVALIVGTVIALWWPARTRAAGGWLDFAFVSVVMLIASPIGWEHYYPLLLPLYAMFVADTPETADARPLYLLMASVVLTGVFLGPVARLESRPFSLLQSYQFAGAVLFLATLAHRIHVSGARRPRPAA